MKMTETIVPSPGSRNYISLSLFAKTHDQQGYRMIMDCARLHGLSSCHSVVIASNAAGCLCLTTMAPMGWACLVNAIDSSYFRRTTCITANHLVRSSIVATDEPCLSYSQTVTNCQRKTLPQRGAFIQRLSMETKSATAHRCHHRGWHCVHPDKNGPFRNSC